MTASTATQSIGYELDTGSWSLHRRSFVCSERRALVISQHETKALKLLAGIDQLRLQLELALFQPLDISLAALKKRQLVICKYLVTIQRPNLPHSVWGVPACRISTCWLLAGAPRSAWLAGGLPIALSIALRHCCRNRCTICCSAVWRWPASLPTISSPFPCQSLP